MLVHHRVTPTLNSPVPILYTWVERSTVRVMCLAQEHNTMSLAWVRSEPGLLTLAHTNHEESSALSMRSQVH